MCGDLPKLFVLNLDNGSSEMSEEQVASAAETTSVSGDHQDRDVMERFQPRALCTDASIASNSSQYATRLQRAARAHMTSFQASETAMSVLVSRKGKAKVA